MSRVAVYSESPSGGDRCHLDVIGSIAGLRFSTSANGDLAASWQMQLDPKMNHRALGAGRYVRLPFGGNKGWRGVMGNPQRGTPWSFTAQGWPWLAKNYNAIGTASNGLNLNAVVDNAITRGLPWARSASLPALTAGSQQDGTGKVADVLNTVCDAKGQLWNVDRDGNVTAGARPTTVAYLLQANDTGGGRTITGFVTDVHVTYWDSTSWATTTILRSATSRPFGRFEDVLDITDLGPITATQAQNHGDNWLAKRGPRLRFTSAFTVAAGQLLSPGGAAVDLATVQARDGLVKVMLTDPDAAAGEFALGAVKVPIGETDYDVDADVLTLTPLDTTPTGINAVFQ